MAGAIAHHFNNQLQVVRGNLELVLAAQPRIAPEPIDCLKPALEATRRASEISTLMLTYLGQTRGDRRPVDLAEICRHCLPMLKIAMPKNVGLESDLPSPGPVICANGNQKEAPFVCISRQQQRNYSTRPERRIITVKAQAPVRLRITLRAEPFCWSMMRK
jgi:signal transduction histidine kinase